MGTIESVSCCGKCLFGIPSGPCNFDPGRLMDFENGSNSIPGIQVNGTVADWTSGYYNGPCPMGRYTSGSCKFIYPGTYPIRIDFTLGDATRVSFLTSNETTVYAEAYDRDNNLVDRAPAEGVAGSNAMTGTMTKFRLSSPNMAYVLIHPGAYNQCLLDDIVTNAPSSICESIEIIPDKSSAQPGEIIRLTANILPDTEYFPVIFKANNTIIGECDTNTGTCYIDWDTTSLAGIYNVTAEIPGQCISDPVQIAITGICSSIFVLSDKSSAQPGEIIRLTANIFPDTDFFPITFKVNSTIIGNCDTTTGSCYIDWDTTELSPDTYNITAEVEGQCISDPIQITLTPEIPIIQAGAGELGKLILTGLTLGMFIKRRCDKHKNKLSCEYADCKWIDTDQSCVKKF